MEGVQHWLSTNRSTDPLQSFTFFPTETICPVDHSISSEWAGCPDQTAIESTHFAADQGQQGIPPTVIAMITTASGTSNPTEIPSQGS